MTLLIASDIPGLLGALDTEIGAAHLITLHDAREILRCIRTTQAGFDVLVLRDNHRTASWPGCVHQPVGRDCSLP